MTKIPNKIKNHDNYFKVAVSAAKQVGKIFVKHFGKAGKTKAKNGNPGDLVTKIDLQIEKLIRGKINKAFPKSKIIGEEFGAAKTRPEDIVWVIDPIDATTNYIRGIPLTCIAIGAWDKQGPLLGVVYNPLINQMYTALRGRGAYLNGSRISVSKTARLTAASGAIGWVNPKNAKKIFNQIIPVTRKLRVLGSSAWQTCLVASGRLDYYATHDVHIWDVGGPLAILREAGGKFTDLNNQTLGLNLKNMAASNGKIHQELIKVIN